MNRQLRKGPSLSSALLPVDGIHLNIQPMAAAGWGLFFPLRGCMFTPATAAITSYRLEFLLFFFLQHCVKQYDSSVFGTERVF